MVVVAHKGKVSAYLTVANGVARVTAYLTSDGKLFRTEEGALFHETVLAFKSWYGDGNEILGDSVGSKVEVEGFLGWLKENKEEVKKVLEFL